MSFVIPFLTYPIPYINKLFAVVENEFPLKNIINRLPGNHLKEKNQDFLDKEGLRKDLIIYEGSNPGFCAASGTNMFSNSDAIVYIA